MLLKDSSKWFNYSQEKEKRKEKTTERKRHEGDGNVDSPHPSTPATLTSAAGSINLDDDISPVGDETPELLRPGGRTITKKAHRNKNVQSDSANLFIEQFDNLRKDQKEIAEQEISMANEREREEKMDSLEYLIMHGGEVAAAEEEAIGDVWGAAAGGEVVKAVGSIGVGGENG
ncbi:hypothetical protein Vadar_016373 [Vaccinium darrowii]|uniref:Uncharacterized protein n=1 Tax=Vaccinium darrowii TaxID=229202 RepID=A0ACB7XAC9_9ERIC|nr:hypothetical protein Vadar_016373 [Vaccinium darrowii]